MISRCLKVQNYIIAKVRKGYQNINDCLKFVIDSYEKNDELALVLISFKPVSQIIILYT